MHQNEYSTNIYGKRGRKEQKAKEGREGEREGKERGREGGKE